MNDHELAKSILQSICYEWLSHQGEGTHTDCPFTCALPDLMEEAFKLFGGKEEIGRRMQPEACAK